MNDKELAYRATLSEACVWLQAQTGSTWNLSRLIENGMTPYVWLDYDAQYPELFGDANGGFAAPIFFQDDTQRLAAGSEDVLITMTKDADKIAIQLPPPGIRAPLADLRFLRKDLNRLVAKITQITQTKKDTLSVKVQKTEVTESQDGITQAQVLFAFSGLVKFNLEKALMSGEAIFGDEGARIKRSAKGAKSKWLWHPVTLALGLNDGYRVPMSRLKRVFTEHDFLTPWVEQWNHTLALLGE
ncbi:hypothetical protein [Undibacterium flavidum]|uniref:Uncharacterized protein n=1 Tax=Undibacterium flavidum TaxID=2762297 RepID=A0ABR6Y8R8_9BURK|nr:hypothetical protein [Undibacterium flavidum]MBC3873003.1 hypothetical protein [Undibacterium flavidum]